MSMDWSKYPNFTETEFRCKHTGKCEMDAGFMERLQALRIAFGHPMKVTSGFRDKTHPIEAAKATSGAHTTGMAVDIAVEGAQAVRLIGLAITHGFTGIGVKQHGTGRFVHLDTVPGTPQQPRPWIWSYT